MMMIVMVVIVMKVIVMMTNDSVVVMKGVYCPYHIYASMNVNNSHTTTIYTTQIKIPFSKDNPGAKAALLSGPVRQ